MKKSVWPSVVDGVLQAPPSKSAAQRAVAIASLCEGTSRLHHVGSSDDVLAAIGVCKALGASIVPHGHPATASKNQDEKTGYAEPAGHADSLQIRGGIVQSPGLLHCGESGLSLRMFSGIAAALSAPVQLTGAKSLMKRPLDIITRSMSALGVDCLSADGRLPVTITGPVKLQQATLDASDSSQLLTGILIAAPLLKHDLLLTVNNLNSKPYIDLTISIMQRFGVHIEHDNYRQFAIRAGQRYSPADYRVEGDWSGAAFMLVAGAVAGKVKLQNLDSGSFQSDKAILDVLEQAGASPALQADGAFVVEKRPLKAFAFDATDCPDLFPPLAALAAHCDGESRIAGTGRLHSKESDRAATLIELFTRLGVKIRVEDNVMHIKGGKIKPADVHAHGDHRIAMAAAIAALTSDGPVHISGAEAVNKSYPDFFDDLEKIATGPS